MAGVLLAWRSWMLVGAGVLVLLLPLLLGYSAAPGLSAWNSFLCGVALTAIGLWAVERGNRFTAWASLLLGLWVMASPFMFGFSQHPAMSWLHFATGFWIGGDGFLALRVGYP